jgi:hypothetical protein
VISMLTLHWCRRAHPCSGCGSWLAAPAASARVCRQRKPARPGASSRRAWPPHSPRRGKLQQWSQPRQES